MRRVFVGMFSDSLVSQFKQARLPLEVFERPLTRAGTADVFQLDIARQGGERFVMFRGASDNRVLVQGKDSARKQLVLMVEEARRAFEVRVLFSDALAQRDQVVARDGRFAWVRRFTEGSKRHLLCGCDEQHLFVAPLSARVSTVAKAHAALFNPLVEEAQRRARAQAIRQGEWFFVPATAAELAAVESRLNRSLFVSRHVPVTDGAGARRGRPHQVDELVRVGALSDGVLPGSVFARGSVRHPDHKTIRLPDWHRVFGNREAPPVRGVTWVD